MSEYVAVVGIDFDGLKPPLRVEAGDPIPKKVPASEITQLLSDGHIRAVGTEEGEGEE